MLPELNRKEFDMGMFQKLNIGGKVTPEIDWKMTPDLSFGTFESWGGRERNRSNVSRVERVYYFFVDNWEDEPKLCLMERGVKHAEVVAEIDAPVEMLKACVLRQGVSSLFEKSYAVDSELKHWLLTNVLGTGDDSKVIPIVKENIVEDMGPALVALADSDFAGEVVTLPSEDFFLQQSEIPAFMKKWNFFEAEHNPEGVFENYFADPGDGLTVVDQRTGLMWQRAGLDITSIRTMLRNIKQLNEDTFAGYGDWRMPTMEEAMSLMDSTQNSKGVYLQPCFSKEQPFIFVNAKRKPGGYWFVDFKQGRTFWSSGTIPGAFARLCRSV
jgi:hypothetical protein